MADTCSIDFNAVDNTTGAVYVSQLWKDLKKEFKGNRRKAVATYLLSKNEDFLKLNSGWL